MSDELMRLLTGTGRSSRQNRELDRKKKEVHDKVNLAAYKADGAMALAGHIMTGANELVDHQRATDEGDPVKQRINAEIMAQAILDIKGIQREVNSEFSGG